MYFVTTKRNGYVLFCTTPSERAAVGLTERQEVHLLIRETVAEDWKMVREWNAATYSHTDFLTALHHVEEPADPRGLIAFLPETLRH